MGGPPDREKGITAMRFTRNGNALIAKHQTETIRIEPWGRNSLRVRTTRQMQFTGRDEALTEEVPAEGRQAEIAIDAEKKCAEITNGRIRAAVNEAGVLTFFRDGAQFLREYYRFYGGTLSRESRCLKERSRTYLPWTGGDYKIIQRFESTPEEKIFGMGQYQQPQLNLKGCILPLEQRNSQASVPFLVSSLGYGFLWNNPAVGRATFGMNITEWIAEAAKELDYWITVSDTPKQILAQYTGVTGRAPMMPDDRMGLWQCKLRYRTQQEVLDVAHAYADRGIPLDVIVIDFFHWPYQGDWRFDPKYWPDPKAMIDELHGMGIKVCVSVWPSVDKKSENFARFQEDGLLMQTERGSDETYDYCGDCVEIDVTNPETREAVWEICKKNYYDLGVDMFWLDNSEPDLVKYDFDNLRYAMGPALECSNLYPQLYSRVFYDHEIADPTREQPVNLLRCCWAGSQKYGNVIWSGDVPSTFEAFRDQLSAGLNMGLAGIPWWTTDIGGFMTDDVNDPYFQELLIRWFQFAAFSAVLRMHGDRGPYNIPALDDRDFGGGFQHTGQSNELWSYGEKNFRILKKYLDIRLSLHDYIHDLYEEAHRNGSPLIRTMFYEFPEDKASWEVDDQYMFGSRYLVAPILEAGQTERKVVLPAGARWKELEGDRVYEGGQTITAQAPIDVIPVFVRE